MTVTLHPADRDPRPDPLQWDEIEQAVVRSTTGHLVLCSADGPTKECEGAALHGPRQYGIRVHARRTANGEEYLVQTWVHGKKQAPMAHLLGPWPVRVDEGQFCIAPTDTAAEIPEEQLERALDRAYENVGLFDSHKDVACVLTGINCGSVLRSVLQADTGPGPDTAARSLTRRPG
ncbi:hypothetical protein [Streptomyces sp. NPDC014744]|uniref:hypothetical protein n=1 Tax=Streptomyces sp. NPDC014744 TaxID=3364903 RepID=UPI0036F6435B